VPWIRAPPPFCIHKAGALCYPSRSTNQQPTDDERNTMSAKQQAPVRFFDLRAQFEAIREEAMAAIHEVVESQQFILGPKVAELEERVAGYCACRYAVGVSSGTDALLVALMALGIGPGDEVITPAFSFFASAGSIYRLGAKPVFVDIDAETYNIDAKRIEAAITPRTRAIIPVHLFGQCADMAAVMEIAAKNDIPVVEDAAQAIGAEHAGSIEPGHKRAGSFGAFGCFSFFPTKNLGAFGEGGMVTTSSRSERACCATTATAAATTTSSSAATSASRRSRPPSCSSSSATSTSGSKDGRRTRRCTGSSSPRLASSIQRTSRAPLMQTGRRRATWTGRARAM
jgi:hypothetical protein